MYQIFIEHRFFCNGKTFDQLIDVKEELNEATKFVTDFVNKNSEFKHHSIIIKEV